MASRELVPAERIERSIVVLRRQRVMLDDDLARLYGVETRALNQAVQRNIERFPDDFMFRLDPEETELLRSQLVMSKKLPSTPVGRGGRRYAPYVFTEQGIAMLSSVLRSERAVQVNIEIMRTFVRLRRMLATDRNLAKRLDTLEKKYDKQFKSVFDTIRQLMGPSGAKKISGRAKDSR